MSPGKKGLSVVENRYPIIHFFSFKDLHPLAVMIIMQLGITTIRL
jgi:hypothetical protein